MEGNVAFVTPQGLLFHSFSQEGCEKLCETIADLQAQREDNQRYQFVVELDDGRKFTCTDILVAYRPTRGRDSSWSC